jgi:hypothetical protein
MVGKVGHYDLLVSEHGAAKLDVQHLAKFLLGCLSEDMDDDRHGGGSIRVTRSGQVNKDSE